jgi:hypothetical protein
MSLSWHETSVFEPLEARQFLSGALLTESGEAMAAPLYVAAVEQGAGGKVVASQVAKAAASTEWTNKGQHAYFPLIPGYKWEYSNGKSYKVVRTISSKTKLIAGVSTRIMTEDHYNKGKKVESWKWFLAINKTDGRVGFFGEESRTLDNGGLWWIDSWYAGQGSNPVGTLLPGTLTVGMNYIREAADDELDVDCTVESMTVQVKAGGKTYKKCVQVLDNTWLSSWRTTYAKGVGEVANTYYGIKLTKFTKG